MMHTFLCYAQMGSQQWHLGAIRTNNAPSALHALAGERRRACRESLHAVGLAAGVRGPRAGTPRRTARTKRVCASEACGDPREAPRSHREPHAGATGVVGQQAPP